MPPVVIRVSDGEVTVEPTKVITSTEENEQQIPELKVVWRITDDGSIPLADPPIEFPWPIPPGVKEPPGGFKQYTGSPVTRVPDTADSWEATMPPMSSGVTDYYKYNIVYANGHFDDPEVENQGVPPQPGG